MTRDFFLLDTHTILFWQNQVHMSDKLITFLDEQNDDGLLYVSPISFWEMALLAKKGRIALPDVHAWKNELVDNTNLILAEPSVTEMIDSTRLPDHHNDPFDRLLVAQSRQNGFTLVTQDEAIRQYEVECFWI